MTERLFFVRITFSARYWRHVFYSMVKQAKNGISIYEEMLQREGGWCEPCAWNIQNRPGSFCMKMQRAVRVKDERENRVSVQNGRSPVN